MGCCGQLTKPKVNRQEINDTPVDVPPIPPPNAQQQAVNSNINSQRAAETLRTNYHKLRFGRW